MILDTIIQQPAEILDYDVTYHKFFAGEDDSVASVINLIIPNTGTLAVSTQKASDTSVKLWVQGGLDGEEYTVEITATMTSGRVKQDEVIVVIQEIQ